MDLVLAISIGGKIYDIAKNVAPHLADLRGWLVSRGIETDHATLDTVVIEAAERKAISDQQVAAGSDPAPTV